MNQRFFCSMEIKQGQKNRKEKWKQRLEKSLMISKDNMPTHLDLHIFFGTWKYILCSHRLTLCPLVLKIYIPFPGMAFPSDWHCPSESWWHGEEKVISFYTPKANSIKKTNRPSNFRNLHLELEDWRSNVAANLLIPLRAHLFSLPLRTKC